MREPANGGLGREGPCPFGHDSVGLRANVAVMSNTKRPEAELRVELQLSCKLLTLVQLSPIGRADASEPDREIDGLAGGEPSGIICALQKVRGTLLFTTGEHEPVMVATLPATGV